MGTQPKNSRELYNIYKNEVIARDSDIVDFKDGSMQDITTGALTTAINEASELMVSEFLKCFFSSATGDDLEFLATDRFGDRFARPKSTTSTTTVNFSRESDEAGDVVISAGTIVKTEKDANGVEVRFSVDSDTILVGTLLEGVPVTSIEKGETTKTDAGKIVVIETALTDSTVVVTNPTATAGGEEEQDDSEYRETIKSLIDALAGATEKAVKGAVQAVPEITYVSVVTELHKVMFVDDGGATFGNVFKIPFVKVYVADADGNYSASLLALAEQAVLSVRACGVKIEVIGALSSSIDWTAQITLNPEGPNYATLASNTTAIKEDMANYINRIISVSEGFNRYSANQYILSIWGPEGTNDLTGFITTLPTGNVAGVDGTKLTSGTMEIA